jgi:acyl-CoA thioester hydrolase
MRQVSAKNTHTIKVAFGDTDAAGIVFYPNFYRWMDQANHELFSKLVKPTSQIIKEGNGFPLVETHCEFKSPLYFDDLVDVQSEVVELKNKVFRVQHTFVRSGETVAFGYEVRAWIIFQDGKLKAVPIPDEIRGKLGFPVETTTK